MAQAGGALVSALVVATCTAFLCAVVLIGLLALVQSAFFGRRRESRKPFRDVDAVTSGHQLEQQTQCPPAAPSGLPISHVGGTLQPFVVVHELHVGEMWLAKLLQVAAGPSPGPRASGLARRRRHRASSVQARTGVRVLVGQAKDGKAQKAAQEWLSVVMNAALARAPLLPPAPAHPPARPPAHHCVRAEPARPVARARRPERPWRQS